jgi:glycosyltransferase involved in cell wall biosynthesis
VKTLIKTLIRRFGLEITRCTPNRQETVASLRPAKKSRGSVLLSYILDPFLKKNDEAIQTTHTNYWESFMIAQAWLDLGYCVDVIDYRNLSFMPSKHYSFLIDVRNNLERLAPLLNSDCIKIMHIDLCHMLFNNAAEAGRLLELQQRRGVTLQPRRFELPNLAIEFADCATMLGNNFTEKTFAYAKKPIYRIPISQPVLYDWPDDKDFYACRKNFMWFGSGGFVRKGLDLVLDVFKEMKEYRLFVCGPISEEKDFEHAYYEELYNLPNIKTLGWTDIASKEFLDVTKNCIGLIYPSSSEGQCGSVVTCLHSSLIPIISYESGVDIDDSYGIILKDCTIDQIQRSVKVISELPTGKLREMSRKAWEFARKKHTRERFAEEYKKIISHITELHPTKAERNI